MRARILLVAFRLDETSSRTDRSAKIAAVVREPAGMPAPRSRARARE